ncbi:MAG TPA: M48 family metalloprotease [Sphingomicrobium sp.]|nr:M48 family metalloprotease [Sphingomicrobium sp.]
MRTLALLMAATATALTPVMAQAQYRGLRQTDVLQAQQQHPLLVEEFGGAETGARAAYVESVGRRVAIPSGVINPQAAYHFTALNSAVENAFSVPGGYVYITRQLMGLMNDEAELGFVLGHEIGHIAANHAQARKAAATRNSVLSVLGAILGSAVGVGNLLSQAAQLRTLSFSREQEFQADELGIRYVTAAGYDPGAGASMLAALARATALSARTQGRANRSTPEWASTHPLSETRAQRALAAAQKTGRVGQGVRNRGAFLGQIEGLYVDDDPAQGIIEGRSFIHPDLRMQFVVPIGYQMQNGTHAVTIAGSAGQAQFSGGRYTGSLEDYIGLALRQVAGNTPLNVAPSQRTTVNGLPAAFTTARANTQSGVIDLSVMAYKWDTNTTYHFVMLTRGGMGIGPFAQMVDSLRRISPAEAAAIRPRIIHVQTVGPNDTVQSLASRMAYPNFKVERFLSLNGLASKDLLARGQKVKLVVYGTRRV